MVSTIGRIPWSTLKSSVSSSSIAIPTISPVMVLEPISRWVRLTSRGSSEAPTTISFPRVERPATSAPIVCRQAAVCAYARQHGVFRSAEASIARLDDSRGKLLSRLAIYGGHFLDMLFHVAGQPKTVSAVVATQFPTLTLTASGQSFPNETPDGVVAIGRLEDDALFSIQIEGGKRNNAGLQIDITGTEGDLKIWNTKSFGNVEDNILRATAEIEARSRRFRSPPAIREFRLPLWTSASRTWAHLYAAYASDRLTGTQEAPSFREGVRTHEMLDAMIRA